MFAIAESEENYDSHSNGSIIIDKVSKNIRKLMSDNVIEG